MCERVPRAGQEMQVSKGGPDLRRPRVRKPGQAERRRGLSRTPGWKAVVGTGVLHTTLHGRQQLDWNGVSCGQEDFGSVMKGLILIRE